MPRRALGAALAAVLAVLAAGCLQSPAGRCDTSADCAGDEVCEEGVCVRAPDLGGNGSGGGADPTSFQPVLWSTVVGSANATFSVASVTAHAVSAGDPASGDLVVAGSLEGSFEPWALATGGLVARLPAGGGAWRWAVPVPAFSRPGLLTALTPGGDVLFAGVAFDPADLGTYSFVPGARGALVAGRLDAAGAPVWVRAVDGAGGIDLSLASVAATGDDLLLAGAGAADFGPTAAGTAERGCGASTGAATFAARLSGSDGSCVWARGLATRTVTELEPRAGRGDAVLGGLCTPTGASFDPGGGTTCASGLFLAVLSAADGQTSWARVSSGSGTVTAVRDLSVAPSGGVAVVGDARGAVSFGAGATDFGSGVASFLATFGASGAPDRLVRPVEAPTAPLPDAAVLDRCAYDRGGKLWVAGRYYGQPTLGGLRFSRCRETCLAASYLARLEPGGTVSSFLPVRIAGLGGGDAALADDLVLFATTGTVAHALRFTGTATVGARTWTGDAGLGLLRVQP